jgi:hypothetical protein
MGAPDTSVDEVKTTPAGTVKITDEVTTQTVEATADEAVIEVAVPAPTESETKAE